MANEGNPKDRSERQTRGRRSLDLNKVTVNLPDEVKDFVADTAQRFRLNFTAMLLAHLTTAARIERQLDKPGAKVIFRDPDGRESEHVPDHRFWEQGRQGTETPPQT